MFLFHFLEQHLLQLIDILFGRRGDEYNPFESLLAIAAPDFVKIDLPVFLQPVNVIQSQDDGDIPCPDLCQCFADHFYLVIVKRMRHVDDVDQQSASRTSSSVDLKDSIRW